VRIVIYDVLFVIYLENTNLLSLNLLYLYFYLMETLMAYVFCYFLIYFLV